VHLLLNVLKSQDWLSVALSIVSAGLQCC